VHKPLTGAFGVDFSNENLTQADIMKVAEGLLVYGVTSVCPTVISSTRETYKTVLDTFSRLFERLEEFSVEEIVGHRDKPNGVSPARDGVTPLPYVAARMPGLHLEGPFLNKKNNGAHVLERLLSPGEEKSGDSSAGAYSALEEEGEGELDPLSKVSSVYGMAGKWGSGLVRIVTLAPELKGGVEATRALAENGIVVSIGHTAATISEADSAVEAGATLITHLFNAMTSFKHREPGVVGLLGRRPRGVGSVRRGGLMGGLAGEKGRSAAACRTPFASTATSGSANPSGSLSRAGGYDVASSFTPTGYSIGGLDQLTNKNPFDKPPAHAPLLPSASVPYLGPVLQKLKRIEVVTPYSPVPFPGPFNSSLRKPHSAPLSAPGAFCVEEGQTTTALMASNTTESASSKSSFAAFFQKVSAAASTSLASAPACTTATRIGGSEGARISAPPSPSLEAQCGVREEGVASFEGVPPQRNGGSSNRPMAAIKGVELEAGRFVSVGSCGTPLTPLGSSLPAATLVNNAAIQKERESFSGSMGGSDSSPKPPSEPFNQCYASPCSAVVPADDVVSACRPFYGLIADGVHVHPYAVSLAFETHPAGLILVTDAMSAMGCPKGTTYDIAGVKVQVSGPTDDYQGDHAVTVGEDGVTPTGTLAGAVVPLDKCLNNLLYFTGSTLAVALATVTSHPAACLGVSDCVGRLKSGAWADLVLLKVHSEGGGAARVGEGGAAAAGHIAGDDPSRSQLEVLQTWVGGRLFDRKEYMERGNG